MHAWNVRNRISATPVTDIITFRPMDELHNHIDEVNWVKKISELKLLSNFKLNLHYLNLLRKQRRSSEQTHGHNTPILSICKGNARPAKHKMKERKFNIFPQNTRPWQKNQAQFFANQKESRNFALAFEHKHLFIPKFYLHYVLGFCKEARNLWTVRRV